MANTIDPSRRRFLLRAAGTAALAVAGGRVLSACGDDDDGSDQSAGAGEGSSSSTPSESTEVVAVTSMMPFAASLGYVLDLAAKSRGHFDAERLDVDVQFGRAAGQALQALLADQVDFVRTGVLDIVPAVTEQGADLVSVAMVNQSMIYALLSSPGNPIRTLDDVPGKTIGLPSLGGNAESTLKLILQEAGLDPASAELVPAGFDAAAYGLVEEGRIDAMFTNSDIRATLEAQDVEIVVADLENVNPLLGLVLAVQREYTESNGDVVVRYLRALDKAAAELQDEALLDEVVADLKGDWDIPALDDPELAKRIIDIQSGFWYVDGQDDTFLRPLPDRWEEGLSGFEEVGAVGAGLDPTDFYTTEFLEEALGR